MSKNNGKSVAAYFLRIAGVLTLICSAVALMLAAVNAVTKEKIADNVERDKLEAVSRIFEDTEKTYSFDADGHETILVGNGEGLVLGYCVTVKPQGYGGEIEMLVGIASDKTVKGVQIISMSETPGVGSRVKSDPAFLPQFTGKSGEFVIGDNVDAISGASISSKAVTAGINEAVSLDVDLAQAAKDADFGGSTPETEEVTTSAGIAVNPDISQFLPETKAPEPESYIDPSSVGEGDGAPYYYPNDNIDVASRDTSYYLEHETTDTEPETDENGNPVSPVTA